MGTITAIGEWYDDDNSWWQPSHWNPYYPAMPSGYSWTTTTFTTAPTSEGFDSWSAAMVAVGVLVATGEAIGKPTVARETTRFGERWVVRWQTRLYAVNGGQ